MVPTLPLPALPGPSQAPGQPPSHLPHLFLGSLSSSSQFYQLHAFSPFSLLCPNQDSSQVSPSQKPLLAPGCLQGQARPQGPGSCPACPSPTGPSARNGVQLNTWLFYKGSVHPLVPSLQLGMPSLPSKGCVSPIPQGTLEDLWRQKLFLSADPKIRNWIFPIRLEVTETKDYALLPPELHQTRLEEGCRVFPSDWAPLYSPIRQGILKIRSG